MNKVEFEKSRNKMLQNIESFKEFDNHKLVSFVVDKKSKLCGFIAIHRGAGQIPAFGATRYAIYNNQTEALKDALRLSRLMSYKSAMAGLNYGGAKGVLISDPYSQKKKLLRSYANKLNCFRGSFITGADVGISAQDVKFLKNFSPFVVGIKTDPVKFTVRGIINSLKVSLHEMFGDSDISKRTFSIQGAGKIGLGVIEKIYPQAKKIFISEIDTNKIKTIKAKFPKLNLVPVEKIFEQKADVFMPCAMAHALNSRTIVRLKSPVVCGGANNQLANSSIGEILYKLGILYAPDYVVNGGGLISVASEFENAKIKESEINKKVNAISLKLKTIFQKSKTSHKATNLVADQMAEKIFNGI